ncbi:hypothetical protein GRI75_07610 [Altererythrobacter soli]|uniref:TonB-dependent receptor n=1 Tax=Croceibacterium soli TaxID=1739690 RepID=A0A6I4US98_9SPHN|nr:hypothetical protein [Croceibacterium soli]MXP41508.1 hypothetical protein [Croceibacterium soli]
MTLRILLASSFTAIAASLAYPAAAQDTAQPAQVGDTPEVIDATDGGSENEIIVIGNTLRGQVDAPQPPILELDEEDIATYGAGSLAELVQALSTETGSGRGRGGGPPTFLVNGLRVSSFREMRSYPPEAIQKVEVLAEEVAQRYGFSPDQRVINFILKDNFSSREIEVEYGQPFDGGTSDKELEATLLNISGPSRLNINLELSDTSLLTEAERGVIQSVVPVVPGDPDQGPYRSLVSDSEDYELTANWTRGIGEAGASLSLNGTAQRSDGRSLSGLDTVTLTDPDGDSALRIFGADNPLTRRTRTDTFSFGSTLNARAGDWQLTGTIDASHADSTSRIDRRAETAALVQAAADGTLAIDGPLPPLADAGFDTAKSKTDSAAAKITAMGNPILLPAGEISVTLDSGYDWQRIDSSDTRNPEFDTELTRGNLNGGVNVSVPIASRRDDAWAFLGDLTANFSAGAEHLSDFGTLMDWSAGLNWGLTEELNFQASYIFREAAPGLSQLGAPTIVNLNVPVYDFTTGQTALATVTTGGNPALTSETQRDIKLGLTYDLPWFDRSNISVEYFRNRSSDVTASFPLLTPDIEAAFPDRVTRGSGGTLLAIDQRPVTFAEQNSQRIRIGLNFSGEISGGEEQSGGGSRGPGPVAGGAPAAAPGGGGPLRATFDPQRFAAIRQSLCAEGDTPPDLSVLPEPMQARLRGADGQIDPQRLAELRTRICSAEAGQAAAAAQGGAAPTGAAPQVRIPGGRGPGGPGFVRGGGPGGRGGPGGGGGRWNIGLNHTIELENEVLIADGGPLLDLLDGDALSGGGVSRHTLSLQGGAFYKGFGTRLSADYQSGTRVEGSGLPGSSDLTFGDLFTLDWRMFADLGRQEKLVESVPFLKNTRVSFAIDNVFDTRQEVTDQNGEVPLRYQPFLMDPVGRRFEIEFRKMF